MMKYSNLPSGMQEVLNKHNHAVIKKRVKELYETFDQANKLMIAEMRKDVINEMDFDTYKKMRSWCKTQIKELLNEIEQ